MPETTNEWMPAGGYFATHAPGIRLGVPNGLRRGQRAAIHELTGHLTLKGEPAIAVLPTGAGKTDVAILLPYLLQARRVLVVVPSDSVRSQIAARFKTLSVVKNAGVLPADTPPPAIKKLSSRLSTLDEWNALREYDVVITTPHAISPVLKGVFDPPPDLFDLLLIDEAHHSPARTWQAVLEAFPSAKRALFTATPFRRDKKQIKGTIVINYSLREARNDGVFGDINYRPVTPAPGVDPDIAIAINAQAALTADRDAGYEHAIMVRADSIPHAEALHEKYRATTMLRLEVVHSHYTAGRIEKTIERLRARELDGVICVNMLGEGFDCPNLKIAALHAPHASLGVTLQFIGRFARVGTEKIAAAQFFAVPGEIQGEMDILFHDDAIWQELIVNLGEARVMAEDQLRADLATFEPPQVQEPGLDEVSLYALRPTYHVKVYRMPDDVHVDLGADIDLPKPFELMYRQHSEELSTVVLIVREQQRPRWSDQLRFGRTEYELFVIHHDQNSRYLFINASRRADSIYRHIATQYVGHAPKGLPLYLVNRTLAGLKKIECFSVGMKSRLHTSTHESYRVVAGRRAQQSIRRTDGRLFHQGHIFCTAMNERNEAITLGYSSGSKLWSSGKGTIPHLVKWCDELSCKMQTTTGRITAPGLDLLEVGIPLTTLPSDVFAVDWDPVVYEDAIEASARDDDDTFLLADCALRVDRALSSPEQVRVILEHDDDEWAFDFTPNQNAYFTRQTGKELTVKYDGDELPVTDFLNEYPLYFYCTSFAKFRGEECFPCPARTETFNRERIEAIDWDAQNVNIRKEFWKDDDVRNGQRSVHEYLEGRLNTPEHDIVLYDHRTGEIADFVTMNADAQRITIGLYHCKGSSGNVPGDRLKDAYEVCGQVVKSFHLAADERRMLKHVRRRIRVRDGKPYSRFVRGSMAEMERIFRESPGRPIEYRFSVVQPGISKSGITDEGLSVLAAANEFIHTLGAQDLNVTAGQ